MAYYSIHTSNCNIYFFRPQLLDIVAATQTDAAVEAAVGFLKEQKDYKIAERFVMASSFATHPRESLVKALLVSTTSLYSITLFVI